MHEIWHCGISLLNHDRFFLGTQLCQKELKNESKRRRFNGPHQGISQTCKWCKRSKSYFFPAQLEFPDHHWPKQERNAPYETSKAFFKVKRFFFDISILKNHSSERHSLRHKTCTDNHPKWICWAQTLRFCFFFRAPFASLALHTLILTPLPSFLLYLAAAIL